jgi:adenosylcobinamide-phosphate synthase
MRTAEIAAACLADAVFGDPHWFPHPVRAIGLACSSAEAPLLRLAGGDPGAQCAAGLALAAVLVGGTYATALAAIAAAVRRDLRAGMALSVALGWTALGARDLFAEVSAVLAALACDDLRRARERVARIVGRDTSALDAHGVARATIETLAESACDGVVAPLFYLAIGGAPLALAFKATSTLDSLIGHREAPYAYFGRASARLDDAANWLPARLTALALCVCAPLAGGSVRSAWRTLRADGAKHASPNAGRVEAAAAGALRVRLGGSSTYGGAAHASPELGAAFSLPGSGDVRAAMRLTLAACVVAGSAIVVSRAAVDGR